MSALTALRRSPGALTRNPVLVLPVLIVGLFQFPQIMLQSTDPLLASLFSLGISGLFILIMPFFQGGIIGMADEALHGRTRLRTFVADGKAHYIPVLVAYLLLLVINFVIGGILFVAAFVGGILLLPQLELSGLALGVVGLGFFLFVLAFLLFLFFVQFYAQAIVLDDETAIDGIKRSVGLVRRNLLSTLGYSLIGGVIGGGLGLLLGAISVITTPNPTQFFDLPSLSLPAIALLALAVIVLGSVIGGFLAIYSVSFYREISSDQSRLTETERSGDSSIRQGHYPGDE